MGGYYFIGIITGIASSCLLGWATYTINHNKGYSSNGFWWGFFLGLIGLIVVCCKQDISNMYYAPTPGAYPQNPSASNYSSPNTYNNPNYSPNPIGYRPAAVGWHCTCGRFHAPSESSCICGQTKYSIAAKKAAAEESPNKQSQPNNPNGETEAQKIAILKQYKDLLDNGTITQEEFEAKKKQLLGL